MQNKMTNTAANTNIPLFSSLPSIKSLYLFIKKNYNELDFE